MIYCQIIWAKNLDVIVENRKECILSVSKPLYCQISCTIEKIELGLFTIEDGQLIPNMSRLKSTEHDNFK